MNNALQRELEIFAAALPLDSTARQSYLDEICGKDTELKNRVEALLSAHEQAKDFLDAPAVASLRSTVQIVTETSGDRIGRYKLLQQIGEGGCGVVYMAEQEEPVRRRVALKVIKLGMDTKSVIARFEAERQALAMMDHPNIAKVLDAGATETGRPYFVMELVKGIPITRYCDENNLATKERLDLFTRVCSAIQHAHQKGIIHRDIKPSNILVTLHDGVAVPKVIDFGIAKATEQRLTDKTLFTAFEQFIGTPAYMSPEQAEMSGLDIDTRSDIYSLGVLLYELLTGKTPFDARELLNSGLEAIRRTIREQEPVRPSTRLQTMLEGELTATAKHRQSEAPKLINLLRGDLDWVVMKALEKDRTRRYESAAGLAHDIQRHLQNEPVTARPASLFYKFQKTARRNKSVFAAAAAVLFALLAGFGVSAWQAIRATRAEAAERRQALQASADRDRAKLAQSEAIEKTIIATNALQSANERMVKLNVAEGWRRVEEGDHFGALLPFAEAFALEQDKPDRAEIHQMRLASVLQHCPKLVKIWSVGTNVRHAEFNYDGSKLLVASGIKEKSMARIWDSASGQPLTEEMRHEQAITFIHWSNDGNKIATASADETARVWDANTGRPLTPPLRMSAEVTWVNFDATGTRLASVAWKEPSETPSGYSANGELAVWDTTTGRAIWVTNAPMLDSQDFAMFTPDGKEVITSAEVRQAGDGRVIRIMNLNARTLEPGETAMWETDLPVNSHRVSFSPRGSTLFIAPAPVRYYYDHNLLARTKIFDGPRFTNELRQLDFSWRVRMGRFNREGTRLAVAIEGHVAYVCGIFGDTLSKPMQHPGAISCLAFSPDGSELATTTANGSARTWSALTGEPLSPPLPHSGPLLRASYSPDGNQLHVIGSDGVVRTWEFRFTDLARFTWPGKKVGINPDMNAMSVSIVGEYPTLYSLRTGDPLFPPFRLPDYEKRAWELDGDTFSPDGKRLHGGIVEGQNSLDWLDWDVSTTKTVTNSVIHTRTWRTNMFGGSHGGLLALSSDCRFVVSTKGDRHIVRESGTQRVMIDEPLEDLSFSDNGKRAIGRKPNGKLVVWRLGTDQAPFEFGDVEPTRYARGESADGRRLLTYCKDRYELWNTDSGERLMLFQARQARISANGDWLAVADGRNVTLHSINDRPVQRGAFRARMEVAWGMQFSPDCGLLLTRDDLGKTATWSKASVWSVPAGELIGEFAIMSDDSLQFGPDSRSLLRTRKEFGIEFWPLLTSTPPATDWLALANFFSERPRLDSRFGIQTQLADCEMLRRKIPRAFAVDSMDSDAFERREAWRSESRKDWSNAVHHLTELLKTHPDSGDFLPRRADAYVAMNSDPVASGVNRSTSPNVSTPREDQSRLTSAATNFLELALADYNRALLWVDRFPAIAKESRLPFVEKRREVFVKLGRKAEAEADERELKAARN